MSDIQIDRKQFDLLHRLYSLDRRCDRLIKEVLTVNTERQHLLATCTHHWADGRSSLDEGWCAICKSPIPPGVSR